MLLNLTSCVNLVKSQLYKLNSYLWFHLQVYEWIIAVMNIIKYLFYNLLTQEYTNINKTHS